MNGHENIVPIRPRVQYTRLTMRDLRREALAADPDSGPWEQVLMAALANVVPLVNYHLLTPIEMDRLQEARAVLSDYRDAVRKRED